MKVENITSDQRAPNYAVYLNLPRGEPPEKYRNLSIGTLAMFGLVEASSGKKNSDRGLSYTLDATEVYARLLAAGKWNAKSVHITFVPSSWDGQVKVQVGSISLYYE